MTRQRKMLPDTRFSDWIREKCPPSYTGWTCSDVDFIVHQFNTKQVMLLEVKRWRDGPSEGKIPRGQAGILRMVHNCLEFGIQNLYKDYTYHGAHIIQFDREFFDDGRCFWDGHEVSEQQLLAILTNFDDRVAHQENK